MSAEVDSADSCWGRGIEVQTCEYCGKTMPIKYYGDVEIGLPVFTSLDEYIRQHDGSHRWMCRDCSIDIQDKLEGKEEL